MGARVVLRIDGRSCAAGESIHHHGPTTRGDGRRRSGRDTGGFLSTYSSTQRTRWAETQPTALELHQPGVARDIEQWASAIATHYHAPSIAGAIRTLGQLDHGRTTLLAVACFAYAALFLTEGIGLWRDRRWAEYLTIMATGSLVPLEVFELMRKVTAMRVGALVVNLLIVVYLVGRLRRSGEGLEGRR